MFLLVPVMAKRTRATVIRGSQLRAILADVQSRQPSICHAALLCHNKKWGQCKSQAYEAHCGGEALRLLFKLVLALGDAFRQGGHLAVQVDCACHDFLHNAI